MTLLALDPERGAALLVQGLTEDERTIEPSAADPADRVPSQQRCDRVRECLQGILPVPVDESVDASTAAGRSQALSATRAWLKEESAPGGMLRRICWVRPLAVDEAGRPFLPTGEVRYQYETDRKGASGSAPPAWILLIPLFGDATKHRFRMRVECREPGRPEPLRFDSGEVTGLGPGVHKVRLQPAPPP